jgi:hypothetical protein
MHLWNDKEKMVELHDKPSLTLFSLIVYVEYSLPNKNNRERGSFVINIARLNRSTMTSYENVISDIPFITAPRIHSLQ